MVNRSRSTHRRLATLAVLGTLLVALLLASGVQANDTYIKAGFVFHPSERDFSNRWLGGLGLDFPVNVRQTFFWGIELQGAVYNVTERGVEGTVIPANGFINFKYKADKFTFRPFVGVGVGLVTSFNLFGGENEWIRHGGFHFQAGMQINAILLEFQAQRAIVDGGVFEYAFLAGFVF